MKANQIDSEYQNNSIQRPLPQSSLYSIQSQVNYIQFPPFFFICYFPYFCFYNKYPAKNFQTDNAIELNSLACHAYQQHHQYIHINIYRQEEEKNDNKQQRYQEDVLEATTCRVSTQTSSVHSRYPPFLVCVRKIHFKTPNSYTYPKICRA